MKSNQISLKEHIKNAISGKGLTMKQAADKLKIGRTTLYSYIEKAEIDVAFEQNVQKVLGIDIPSIRKIAGQAAEPQLPVKKEDEEELITGVPYDVMMKLADRTEEPQSHEGDILKAYIKGRGFVMEDFARNEMGMTEQNMYINLRKPVLSEAFRLKVENILGVDFYRDVMGKSKKSILEKIDTESFRELMYELFTRIEKLENQI